MASRPKGIPAAINFTLVRTELEPMQDLSDPDFQEALAIHRLQLGT